MKKLLKCIGWILVVIALLFVALSLSLDRIIPKSFNAAVPSVLGVPATLQSANVTLLTGKASLRELHIGNPAGYKTDGLFDLASVSVYLDNSSLLTDTIVIKKILVDGLVVTYEKGLFNSNLGAFLESLPSEENPTSTEPTDAEKPGKKVVIEKVVITHARMHFSVTGAAALTGGGAIPIPLPTITLTDLGKEKEGITIVEAIRRILTAIAGATGTAIAGSAKLLGQGVAAVGDGAWAVGSAGVDAGKAIVGGTVNAGKAVVGGTVDAGKAVVGGVGDALHAINPFKK